MKIMYDYQILWLQEYGGISRYFHEIIHGIRADYQNVEVEIPVLAASNQYFKGEIFYKKWKFKTIERAVDEIWTVLKIIHSHITGNPYDIIHLTFYLPLIWDKFVKRKQSKIVITVYDMIHEKYICEDKRLIRNKKKLMEKADGIITISERTKKDMLEIYPQLNDKKIRVIYLGNSMGINPKVVSTPPKYVLFVGNREGYKNFSVLLEAFSRISENDNSISLVCAGGGQFSEKEKVQIQKYKLEKKIIQMTVDDAELAYLYKEAFCMVFPSLYEGFGIPILEAFYWKCPVILSDCSCFPEIAEDAGLYFKGNSSDDLYGTMLRMIENESLRNNLKEKGTLQLKKYTWEKTVTETYNFYKELLESK